MIGWIRRKTRWEFWPPWLAYIPVVPYVLYLGIKHRSLTLFTAANPGIPSGGFVGESKSAILSSLGRVPDFLLLSGEVPADVRIASVNEFMMARKLTYPIVLKPDVGERGTGVTIARNDEDMHSYLKTSVGDTIVQKYIAGLEFGIFYYRYPGQSKGRIFSITEKHFPSVVGDGVEFHHGLDPARRTSSLSGGPVPGSIETSMRTTCRLRANRLLWPNWGRTAAAPSS